MNNNNSPVAAILTKGGWTIVAASMEQEMSDGSRVTNDIIRRIDSCVIDNSYTLQKGGTVLIDEGETKCDESDAQQRPGGKWALSGGDKKLKIPAPVIPDAFKPGIEISEVDSEIVFINDDRLEITYTLDYFFGLEAVYHIAYER